MRYSDLYSGSYMSPFLFQLAFLREISLVRDLQCFDDRRFGLPAQADQGGRIERLERHAVRFGRVEVQLAGVADDVANELGRLADRQVFAAAQVDRRLRIVVLAHDEQAGIGEIVGEDEFAAGRAGSPDRHRGERLDFGFVELADQGRNDVPSGRAEFVLDSEGVGRDGRNEIPAMLPRVSLAQFDAGDFRRRVGVVGRFQGTGHQRFDLHRLWTVLRIAARTADVQKFLHAVTVRRVNDVAFRQQVVEDQVGGKQPVGLNSTRFARGKQHVFGAEAREEGIDLWGIA